MIPSDVATAFIDALPTPLVVTDGSGTLLFRNRAAAERFGRAEPGREFPFSGREVRDRYRAAAASALAGRSPPAVDLGDGFRARLTAVSERAVLATILDGPGCRANCSGGAAPAGAWERFGSVAARLPAVVYEYRIAPDGSDTFTLVAGDTRRFYGCTPEELAADAGRAWRCVHPDDVDGLRRAVVESASTLAPFRSEHRVQAAGGPVRWLRAESRPRRGPDGSTVWDGVVVEVTDHRAAEQARRIDGRAGPEVLAVSRDVTAPRGAEGQPPQADKLEAVARLAGGVAHDFNNLLTVINGFASIVRDAMPESDPNRALLGEVLAAGDRAAALVRQLLAFGRKQIARPRVVELNEVVESAAGLLRRLLPDAVRLRLELDPAAGHTRADPVQLERVLLNLTVNARDALPRGGTVTVATGRAGGSVRLTVADTGVGMTDGVKARLFEPFFTTKNVGEGVGLDLAVVAEIVQAHGGTVTVASAPGEGATFTVDLPAAEGPASPA